MRGKQLFPLPPAGGSFRCGRSVSQRHPHNVILILMDNPSLRTLAREGMTLTRHYSPAAPEVIFLRSSGRGRAENTV